MHQYQNAHHIIFNLLIVNNLIADNHIVQFDVRIFYKVNLTYVETAYSITKNKNYFVTYPGIPYGITLPF